jgi:3-methyladenine DNA glycosylase AlkD
LVKPDLEALQIELEQLGDAGDAVFLARYFKTGPGEYGEGDRFRGIRVPVLRKLAKQYRSLDDADVRRLLTSPFHEDRLTALLILVEQAQRADRARRAALYRLYLDHTAYINNWDLVDLSAGKIVGAYLYPDDVAPLFALAGSDSLWERRIAIMATSHFIAQGHYATTLQLAERLLHDDHDLIHKAVGWMLREVGNRDHAVEEAFLQIHYRAMPRTMLRYAIEKFPEERRQAYLRGEV